MPIRYLASAICGLFLLILALLTSCRTANPTEPLVLPATRIEPTHAPTLRPSPGPGDTRTRTSDGMVAVYVPAGSFQMGSTE